MSYSMPLEIVILFIVAGLAVWSAIGSMLRGKTVWVGINGILLFFAVYEILNYTFLGRIGSSIHKFTVFASYTNEFWREMLMNVFLYYPLGLSLPNVIRSYRFSILIALILSISIEAWQYFAGAGLAQGTDVICNTLGVVIGGLSFLIITKFKRNVIND